MYVCSLCEVSFETVDSLCGHLIFFHHRLHSSTFVCYICRRPFKELYAFKRHLNKNHHDVHAQLPVLNEAGDDNVNHDTIDSDNESDHGEINGDQGREVDSESDHSEDNDDQNFSVEYFVNALYQNIQLYIAQLYQIPNISRKLVDSIVVATSELISSVAFNLKRNVFKFINSFQDVPINFADDLTNVESMFETLMNPFEGMRTEHQRFQTLEAAGSYIPPVSYEIGHEDKFVKQRDTVELVRSPVYGQFVPIRHVLKCFLELPNVFDCITNYLDKLSQNPCKLSNLVQGTTWKHNCLAYDGKIVLPINIEFDDYEPDNVLGSHNAAHSLGALYAVLPCLPPEHQSSLDNMFLFCLFESKYRKKIGNAAVFSCVIQELIFLGEEGILINVNDQEVRVYFCLCVVIADNAGNNSISGFIESFRANFYCRMCKLHRDEMSTQSVPVPANRLRTIENYAADVLVGDSYFTGVNEECVWNRVPNFHCISNRYCDIMHGIFEGVLKYDLCNILYYFVEVRGYIEIDLLKDRIDGFEYGPSDICNRIPTLHCTVSNLKDCSWNLSASEYLCLGRHLCLIIGDLIPEGNNVWKLYAILREILEILISPVVDSNITLYLQKLIEEHHKLYIECFGHLKPKHHFLLHQPDLLVETGPLVHLSALASERNHRRGKNYARVCNSRVNTAKSIAIKFQLMLSERLSRPDNFKVRVDTFKVFNVHLHLLPNYLVIAESLPLNANDIVCTVKKVKVSGTLYSLKMVIVMGVGELMPSFGRIVNILINGDVYFVVKLLKTVGYLNHFCSYEVIETDNFVCLKQQEMIYYVPLWGREYKNSELVCLKHGL